MPDMNRFFNEMRSWWDSHDEMVAWSPDVNVYGKGDQIVVEAEIPGMKKNEIEVSVENHTLTLSGERKEDAEIKQRDYFRHERSGESFCRSITLPTTVDAEKIDAKYENGVLTLSIPKTQEAKAKHIEIH
jgi:HSP20 family protein